MSMHPIFRFVVAALLLTGSAAGIMAPAVSDTPATTPPAVTETTPETAELTAEEAIAIALEHAALTKADVTDLKARRETDDKIPHYDVEFVCGNWEYEYEIHAVTGKILEWDKDYEPPKKEKPTLPPATEPAPTEPTPTEPTPTEPAPTEPTPTEPAPTEPPVTEPPVQEVTQLTQEQALAIALEHAGLTAEQVTNVRGKLERDDGVAQWEIEFRCGDYEYDYDIHAETGKILEWDKELDD